jgi:hypothetical protein
MDAFMRVERRHAAYIAAVGDGRLKLGCRLPDERRDGLSMGYLRHFSVLWGHVMNALKFNLPNVAVIAEYFGATVPAAIRRANASGGSAAVATLKEAVMLEHEFSQWPERRSDGACATVRSRVSDSLCDGQCVSLLAFSILFGSQFDRRAGEWFRRLNAANPRRRRGRCDGTAGTKPTEPYTVGCLGFTKRDGVVRPRLDLIARRLYGILVPLYSPAAEMASTGDLPSETIWQDMAEVIATIRGRHVAIPIAPESHRRSEFDALTAVHVRMAVRG